MPQTNPDPNSLISRWFKDIFRRLKALEMTVPIAQDSDFQTFNFDTASTTYVHDGATTVGPIRCFGNKTFGTNVQVTGSCEIGLDGVWSWAAGLGGVVPVWPSIPTPIGGIIGVRVDGGSTIEPGSGPGIYFLAVIQASLGGIQNTITGSRVIQVVSPAATQGLSEHTFDMMFLSTMGQTVHFEIRILTVNPQ